MPLALNHFFNHFFPPTDTHRAPLQIHPHIYGGSDGVAGGAVHQLLPRPRVLSRALCGDVHPRVERFPLVHETQGSVTLRIRTQSEAPN